MDKIMMMAVLALAASATLAKTNYVDCVNGVDAKTRGTAEDNAWATLQYAVTQCAAEDTLIVLPGVYSNGLYETAGNCARFRLGKKLTIESRDGRDSTIVLGEYDPDWQQPGEKGSNLTNGVRCATFQSASAGSVLKGLTFRNGCAANGGGVNATKGVWFVDCAFVNCIGYNGSAMYGGDAVRCLFDGCISNNRHISSASLWNCVVTGCSGGGTVLAYCREIVNCTVVANPDSAVRFSTPERSKDGSSLGSPVCNSLICLNAANGYPDKCWTNCVTTSTQDEKPCDAENSFAVQYGASAFQVVSPLEGDWHLIPGCAAKTAGNGDLLAAFASVPEEYRYTDFYGNAIPRTGTIAVGAVQSESEESVGFVQLDAAGSINGKALSASGLYVSGAQSRMVRIKAVNAEKHLFNYLPYENGAAKASQVRFPEKDGSLSVMMPPAGETIRFVPAWAKQVLYVDQATGSDDYDGTSATVDGSHGPKATIQEAVDAAPGSSDNTVIYVGPGDYRTGGRELYGLQCRVAVTNHAIRLVATGSVAETIIRGAADPDYVDDTARFGCGPRAVRCYAAYNMQNAIQGFTLTDGHTMAQADTNKDQPRRGAAYQTNGSQYSQMLDCIVSNNVGAVGGAVFSGWHLRCRFEANRILQGAEDIVRNCYLSSCVFGPNFYGKSCSAGIGTGANMIAWHCTFRGPSLTEGPIFRGNSCLYNSVAVDFYHTSQTLVLNGNVFCNFNDYYSSLTSGFVEGDPSFVNKEEGDYRVNCLSKAIGAGATTGVGDWWKWATCGIDGAPIQFTDGKPTAGAYQKPLLAVTAVGKRFEPAGVSSVEPGGSLTLTATGAGTVRGYVVNGVTNLTDATSWTVTAEDRAYAANEAVTVELLQDAPGLMILLR